MTDADEFQQIIEELTRLKSHLSNVIVGQQDVIDLMLMALLSGGHALLVGVPGLAKTLMVKTMAEAFGLDWHRIQFTPDLMPADITGTEILQYDATTERRTFVFQPGPIFAPLVLADEINRTSPKTQSALLEAMQERQVTVSGTCYPLPHPFFVLATQNPLDQEGTYPLPEAQIDRFVMQIQIDYPTSGDEFEMLKRTTAAKTIPLKPIFSLSWLEKAIEVAGRLPISDHLIFAAMQLTRMTRPGDRLSSTSSRNYLAWGAGPRAGQALIRTSKVAALLNGETMVRREHLLKVAPAVLRHRLIPNYQAQAEQLSIEHLVSGVLTEFSAYVESDKLIKDFELQHQ